MEVGVLGPMQIARDGVMTSVGPHVSVVLAALVIAGGQPLSNARLQELLWPGAADDRAATLRSHVSHLRRSLSDAGLADAIVTGPAGYRLRMEPGQVDAWDFRQRYDEARTARQRGDSDRTADLLHAALTLWRGPAYEGLQNYAFVAAAASDLEAARQRARLDLAEIQVGLGRHRDALSALEELVESEPNNEHARRLYALATYRAGRIEQAASICRDGLQRIAESGLTSPRLDQLHIDILRRSPSLDWHPPTPIFDMPARPRTFTGRTTLLAEIDNTLGEFATELGAVALHGLGGVGKTALAAEYAYRNADRYRLVCWIPSDESMAITSRLAALARRLGIPDSSHPEDMITALWERLRQDGAPWLLIYDDVDSPEALASVWPRAGHGHVLVTSRNRNWGRWAVAHEVTPLNRVESIQFITERLTGRVEQADAESIAQELADLPLALEQACAYVEETQVSVASYLQLLGSDDGRQLLDLGAAGHAERTVTTTWNVSLRKVRTEAPAAEQLLHLGAFLGPPGIPRDLITHHADLLPDPLHSAAAHPITFNNLMAVIGRYSLAQVSESVFGIHPLVQTVIRGALPTEAAARWAGTAVQLLDEVYSDDPTDEASWPLLGHVVATCRHARRYGVPQEPTVSLLTKAAYSATHFGDPRQTADLLSGALDARGSNMDDARVGDILVRLGHAHRELGELTQARVCFEQAIEVQTRLFGPGSTPLAQSLTGLGVVLFDLFELDAAHRYLTESLKIRERNPDLDELSHAVTLTVLGLVLWRLHDLPAASAAFEQALHIREDRLGPDHQHTATSLDNLAKVIFDLGNKTEARAMNERALAIREAQLGADHYHVAISLNHLGYVLRELDEIDHALATHTRALEIFQTRLGPRHSHVARTLAGIGAAHLAANQPAAAHEALNKAVAIFSETMGETHTETALARADLGRALEHLGDPTTALAVVTAAFEIIATRLPAKHPDHIRVRDQLNALEAQGEATTDAN